MLFFWKQNSSCIFSNKKSEGHFYNYIQQQKGSDVMGARKIHLKLYYMSPWRLISEPEAFWGSCEGVQPLLRTGQHLWLWKTGGEHKLLGSISYAPLWHGDTALSEALAPFPSALVGSPCPLLRRFIELCGSSKGPDLKLQARLWLPQELSVLHSSQSYSVLPGDTNLKASASGEVTFALILVSTFSRWNPCRIHYTMVMAPWPKISTNQAHFQQGFYIVSNA